VVDDFRKADEFGIPITMFGYVSELFYATIGRVAMLAALIDTKMLELLWALDDHTQDVISDRYGNKLEDLVMHASRLVGPKLGKDIRRMLNEAGRLRGWRNDIIHSVSPNPTDEHAFAWRPGSPKTKGASPTKTFVTSKEELMTLITDMIKLIGDLGTLAMRAQPEKFRRMSENRLILLPTEHGSGELPFVENEPAS
jgi:hypothetical protein